MEPRVVVIGYIVKFENGTFRGRAPNKWNRTYYVPRPEKAKVYASKRYALARNKQPNIELIEVHVHGVF